MRPADRSMMEGARAIIIEQAIPPQDSATAAEVFGRLLRRWRPALVIALVAAGTVGYWDFRRSGRLQSLSFTVARPTSETPSMPGNVDLTKALNAIPSQEWNIGGGRGRFEARSDKATNGIELTFSPASSDDSTTAICRTEADRLVGELNTLLEPDFRRTRISIDATIDALDRSIAEVSALAHEHSGANGISDAVLLTRQAADMRERQAAQLVVRDSMQAARIIGNETVVRKSSIASPPITGAIAGCIAFVISLFVLAFGADVAAAYRAGPARNP